jgi:HK97 family phage major capsid protein
MLERQLGSLTPDQQRQRTSGNSAFVPMDMRMNAPGRSFSVRQIIQPRDMDVTVTPNVGREFVAEDFIPSLIEFLRAKLVIKAAGATVLSGLQGNVIIPKQVGPSMAYWQTESGAVPPSDLITHQVGLRPRRLSSMVVYSRQLVQQSSLDIEMLVRSDMAASMALELDRTAIFGDPGVDPNTPRGLFGFVGFPPDAVDPTDNIQVRPFQPGAMTLYESYIDFVTALEAQDIPLTSGAWIINPVTWGQALATPKFPNTGFPIVDAGNLVIGYPYLRTNIIPSSGALGYRVVFGDFAQMLLGNWIGFELVIDPYSRAERAQIRVVANIFSDLNLRYRRAFVLSDGPVGGVPTPPREGESAAAPPKNTKK